MPNGKIISAQLHFLSTDQIIPVKMIFTQLHKYDGVKHFVCTVFMCMIANHLS